MPRDARFPKQELWLQMVKREYPHLLDASVPQFEESLSDSWGSTLPHLVQDHPSYTQGLGDLAWVWGQSLQPRLEGKRVQTIPDPLGSFRLHRRLLALSLTSARLSRLFLNSTPNAVRVVENVGLPARNRRLVSL